MKKYFINILTFLLYFIYFELIVMLINYLGFNYNNFSYNKKVLLLFISNFLFMIYLLIIYRRELKDDLKDYKKNFKGYINKYFIYYVIGVALMAGSNLILQKITGLELSGNESTLRELIKSIPIYMGFSTVLYAPFVEEIIFRKSIRNVTKNKKVFVLLSGFIFGILHITSFSNVKEIIMGIPYIIMGIDFAVIYVKSNNIFTTMIFHLFHNLILFLMIIL